MSDNAAHAPQPHGLGAAPPDQVTPDQKTSAEVAPAQAPRLPEAHFLLFEEYSVYRREFLGRAGSVVEAQAQALVHSRRSRQPVIVRRKETGSLTSAFVSAYRAGRRVYPETSADGTSRATS